MVGSIPALIAHVAFVGLLAYGWAVGELQLKQVAVFLALWLLGRLGFKYVPYEPARNMFSSFVAVVDIALVFLVFQGDVRLNG
jgi:hypothetical protein